VTPTAADYANAFERERQKFYPQIEAFERLCGYALEKERMEFAAKYLACPVKANGANWQHGRVLYSALRKYLDTAPQGVVCLDIGTAKGFSALCLRWALDDAGVDGQVVSLDVLDPTAKVRRNTVLEVDGYLTLAETLERWPEAKGIQFLNTTGIEWLRAHPGRVHFAYVDGKHTFATVNEEAHLLAKRQQPGDVAIFDDVQIEGVAKALGVAAKFYDFQTVTLSELRAYSLGVRRA
jgi:predicted O-methyltransferase YrrM